MKLKSVILKLLLITCAVASTFLLSSCLTSIVACASCSKNCKECSSSGGGDTYVNYELNPDGESYCLEKVGKDVGELEILSQYKGKPVTEIGRYAFIYSESYGCSSHTDTVTLSKLTIPSTITRVADQAVYYTARFANVYYEGTAEQWCKISFGDSLLSEGCKLYIGGEAVTRFQVPESVTDIGKNVFANYTLLEEVVFHEDVKSIGESAFAGCKYLTAPVLPYGLKEIGEEAFAGCLAFEEITLPMGLDIIPESLFENCSNLKTVNLTAGISDLGRYAFKGCTSLRNIDLSFSTFKTIPYGAFLECVLLENIVVPETVISIEENAFANCVSLYEIYNLSALPITAGESSYGGIAKNALVVHSSLDENSAVQAVGDFLFITVEKYGEIEHNLVKYRGTDGVLSLPENFNGESYFIHNYAFVKNSDITQITVPEAVTEIGEGAFSECLNLQTVYGMQGVEVIGNSAFLYCSELSAIDISPAKEIGASAFEYCSALGDIKISASRIGASAFKHSGITSAELKEGIKIIKPYTFANCYNLTRVNLPEGLESIEKYAFAYANPQSIVMPQSLKVIDGYAFKESGIKSLNTGGAEEICAYAFSDCMSLQSLEFTQNLKIINAYAFNYCTALTGVKFPASLEALSYLAFNNCTNITSLSAERDGAVYFDNGNCIIDRENKTLVMGCKTSIIPDDGAVERIGQFAFESADFTSVVIPASVRYINKQCFWRAQMTEITIMGAVDIGAYAFANCSKLEKVIFKDKNISLSDFAFEYCDKLEVIEYAGKVSEWRALEKSHLAIYRPITVKCSDGKIKENWN